MGVIGVDDRLRAIRERWLASEAERDLARTAVIQRDLGLANDEADLQKRQDRLERRHLRLEGIVDHDDSVWLSFFNYGLQAARPVGRIVATDHRPAQPVGTGSLVADRLLLTNNHVCPSAEEAADMAVQFGYEYDEDGQERPPDQWPMAPVDLFVTDPELDYSLIAVATRDGKTPGEQYGHIPLIGQTGKAVIGEVLNVIHHPAGERKRVSIRFNRFVSQDDLWVRYESDTREGSSGAPVFNDQWEMVALHHGGISATDKEGFELARDGRRWTEDMGEDALAYVGNEGARVSRIVHSLSEAAIPAEHRDLLAPILNGE
jgi:hypothetical protein